MLERQLPVTAIARVAYLLLILGATLTRLRLDPDPGMAAERLGSALNPMIAPRDVVDAARNFVLFAGWGAVWMITAPGRGLIRSVLLATALGALISVSVETVQLFSPVRQASILDVFTNSAGAFAGAIVMVIMVSTLTSRRGKRSFVGVPAVIFAFAYASAVVIEALIPLFRQERVPHAWGGPASRFTLALDFLRAEPFTSPPMLDALLFLPAGAFLVAALVEFGIRYRSAAIGVSVLAPLIFTVVQLARGVMGLPIQTGALLTHSLSVAAGAMLTAATLPALTTSLRGRHRPLALLVMYFIIMTWWSWRPYLPVTDVALVAEQFSMERLVPLRALYFRGDIFSATTVIVQFLLFMPLGALLAVWPLRQHGPLAHLLPAIYLAVLLEAGQLLVLGRFFDITDIILQCAGAAVAWLLVRRTGYKVYGELLATMPGAGSGTRAPEFRPRGSAA